MKYKITYGISGCFDNEEIIETENYEKAEHEAWLAACEIYDSYAGAHGIKDVDDIMEEDEVSDDEAYTTYMEERESEIDFNVELIKEP